MAAVYAALNQAGQHVVIYGDRGVGKTSLSRVVQLLVGDQTFIAYYTCSSDDSFGSIWPHLLDEIEFTVSRPGTGFGAEDKTQVISAKSLLDESVTPDGVRRALSVLALDRPALLFVDEFDRVRGSDAARLMADTIKILSDHAVDATVVLVGVGDTIDDLVREHASIGRSIVQVKMPRMTLEESSQIIRAGMEAAEMTVDEAFVLDVAQLSQGMPHYTHLLGQHGATVALDNGRLEVTAGDVVPAIKSAISQVSQTQSRTYHNATFSNRETLHKQVLLACALADKDDLGFFGAPSVRDQLKIIARRNVEIPAFASHLKEFSGTDVRGGVLQKAGARARFRYRFIDPLLPPYVVMRGRNDGLVGLVGGEIFGG
jgi:Cdc6-like AAA superfamily ATPase